MNKYVTAYRVTVLIVLLLLSAGSFVVVKTLRQIPTPPRAVTTYEIPVITTNNKALCAGDKVIYDQTAHFRDTPTSIRVVTTLWSIDRNTTVISDKAPSYVNYMQPTTVHLHGEWVVPNDLPPGKYERRFISTAEGRQSDGFVVAFTVGNGC